MALQESFESTGRHSSWSFEDIARDLQIDLSEEEGPLGGAGEGSWRELPSWGSLQVDPEWSEGPQLDELFSQWTPGSPIGAGTTEATFIAPEWATPSFPLAMDDSGTDMRGPAAAGAAVIPPPLTEPAVPPASQEIPPRQPTSAWRNLELPPWASIATPQPAASAAPAQLETPGSAPLAGASAVSPAGSAPAGSSRIWETTREQGEGSERSPHQGSDPDPWLGLVGDVPTSEVPSADPAPETPSLPSISQYASISLPAPPSAAPGSPPPSGPTALAGHGPELSGAAGTPSLQAPFAYLPQAYPPGVAPIPLTPFVYGPAPMFWAPHFAPLPPAVEQHGFATPGGPSLPAAVDLQPGLPSTQAPPAAATPLEATFPDATAISKAAQDDATAISKAAQDDATAISKAAQDDATAISKAAQDDETGSGEVESTNALAAKLAAEADFKDFTVVLPDPPSVRGGEDLWERARSDVEKAQASIDDEVYESLNDPFIVISSTTYMVEFSNSYTVCVESADDVVGMEPWDDGTSPYPKLYAMVAGQVRIPNGDLVDIEEEDLGMQEPEIYSWVRTEVPAQGAVSTFAPARDPIRVNGWTVVSATNDILPTAGDNGRRRRKRSH